MNLTMSRTLSRLVSGRGWGLWTTVESVPLTDYTREPARSTTFTPSADNSEMMSAQRMIAGVGVGRLHLPLSAHCRPLRGFGLT